MHSYEMKLWHVFWEKLIQTHTPCYLNDNKNITYTKGVLYGIELTVIKELAILKSQEPNGDINWFSILSK